MGVIAEGIPRGCQGLFTPVSLGYPLSVFNKKLYSQTKNRYVYTSTYIYASVHSRTHTHTHICRHTHWQGMEAQKV